MTTRTLTSMYMYLCIYVCLGCVKNITCSVNMYMYPHRSPLHVIGVFILHVSVKTCVTFFILFNYYLYDLSVIGFFNSYPFIYNHSSFHCFRCLF